MAWEAGLSHTTVRRIRKALGLQLHRSETFNLSSAPPFVDKARDVAGLYLSLPDHGRSASMKKPRATPRQRTTGLADDAGHARTADAQLRPARDDVATGFVISKWDKRCRAREFLDFLKEIDACVPENLEVRIVMDNDTTHKAASIKAGLARNSRDRPHFAPTSASWIARVDR